MKFTKLLEPGYIGEMHLRNRMIQPAMGTSYTDAHGYVTKELVDYYYTRAIGGIGLVITEICAVAANGRTIESELQITSNAFIPGLKKIVDAVHAGGAKVCLQLAHGGCFADTGITGEPSVSPSGVSTFQLDWQETRPMTIEEIKEVIVQYGESAKRAKAAGFDAVEVHGAHGFLPLQFLSPYTNRRTDEYGGSFENRARFGLEIIREIRKNVGNHFPIIYRLSAEENTIPEGLCLEEACKFAQLLEKEGVNAIHVTAGTWDSRYHYFEGVKNGTLKHDGYNLTNGIGCGAWIPPYFAPRGLLVPFAEAVKKCVSVPIIAVNSVSPEIGEQALLDGKADFIAIGRQSFADPEYPNKIKEGRAEDIRRCLRCNECQSSLVAPYGVQCSVNPELGKEGDICTKMMPVITPKKVAVIGAGPAGMVAAIVAAKRGQKVTLFEKTDKLGGALYYASIPSFKSDFGAYLKYLEKQVKDLNIEVRMSTLATVDIIKEEKFESVIVATGAQLNKPGYCEICDGVLDPLAILGGDIPAQDNIIVCGAGLVGCETALFLAEHGKKVTMIDMAKTSGPESAFYLRYSLWGALLEAQIDERLEHKIIHMDKNNVICEYNGEKVSLNGDAVVCALGMKSDRTLYDTLIKELPELEIIPVGDMNSPRKVLQAVHEGYHAGRRV